MVNAALCFTAAWTLRAAKAAAGFGGPFAGRRDDLGESGMALIAGIGLIFKAYRFRTEMLAASVRGPMHVAEAAKPGARVATLPPPVVRLLFNHPLTGKGLAAFLADWSRMGRTIA